MAVVVTRRRLLSRIRLLPSRDFQSRLDLAGCLASVRKMSQPEDPIALPMPSPMADRLAFLPRSLQQYAAGNVSRSMLLTRLLPQCFIVRHGCFALLGLKAEVADARINIRTQNDPVIYDDGNLVDGLGGGLGFR